MLQTMSILLDKKLVYVICRSCLVKPGIAARSTYTGDFTIAKITVEGGLKFEVKETCEGEEKASEKDWHIEATALLRVPVQYTLFAADPECSHLEVRNAANAHMTLIDQSIMIEEDHAKRATTPTNYKTLVGGLTTAEILLRTITIVALWAFK